MKKIMVLAIDDSALMRKILSEVVNAQADMQMIGTAPDPIIARQMIKNLNPDVITLDIEMPKMDGLEFLEKLMRLRPTPVVMISTLTEKGAQATLAALELGAIDFISKPKIDVHYGIEQFADEIAEKIRVAATARLRRSIPQATAKLAASAATPPRSFMHSSSEKLIIIGASTGGTEALKVVLTALPHNAPAVLVTQHMPAGFTASFAKRMDGICQVNVKEAEHNERVLPGHVYIAPGSRHMALGRNGANYCIVLSDEAPVNRHRPSVAVLFESAAKYAGANAVGIMLTGMGKDGASAMRLMKDKGAFNLAQDEATCVVFGMPKEAIAAGAVDEVLPLGQIAARALEYSEQNKRGLRI